VATAVAYGDLSQKITVDARGEILGLKKTLNTMVDQLSSFADEVTRVAREVGTDGVLGGQAEVEGVSGTWRDLTENVNQLAGNLTTQVRAIAEVSTAVTQGDLTRQIAVEARGEVAELSDTINQMIANLRETTQKNAEQDWLNTNLARISGLMQGQRDLVTVSRLIMSEISPLVTAQHGAFFLTETTDHGDDRELRLIASYGYKQRKSVSNRFRFGEALVGQAALEGKSILITNAPGDYIKVTSGLGESTPVNIIVMPILFEEQVLAVVELASLREFSEVNQTFLEQLAETLGVVLNAIIANRRTEELLEQEELKRSKTELEQQAQSLRASEELLQTQQEELQQTNEELQEKAELLSQQNRDIELQNAEIERASAELEEKATQLALSSRYKSEFLANMSHELRTPLNSLLILSKLLAENPDQNLTDKQMEFASTIHTAGGDLLSLISDILDLSKVEAGKMEINPGSIELGTIRDYVERAFSSVAEQKGLQFQIQIADDAPATIFTDEQRLQQVLRNLLSNAFKFTESGTVTLLLAAGEQPYALSATVSDTGIGIGPDKLRHIFEAFQQADGTTSRRFGGTGLGLSISREIARALGGRIAVQSRPGEGSAFELLLPAYVPPPPTQEPTPSLAATDDDGPGEPIADEPLPQVDDDRALIVHGDRVALVIDDDPEAASRAVAQAREHGFRAVVAPRGNVGLTLAHEVGPDLVVLATAVGGGGGILDQLKHHPRTRHIPVYVVADAAERGDALRAGAAGFLERPVDADSLASAFTAARAFLERTVRKLLVVDDDEAERMAISELVGGGEDIEVTAVGSSEAALAALQDGYFDCIVLDLKLPKMTGFSLLDHLKEDERHRDVPVIIHTGSTLTRREETRLRRYADSIIVKDAASPERLLDETALFLHRPQNALPAQSRRLLEQLHTEDAVLPGKRVLIVDDDVRNVFALTSALEARGMVVRFAENGREAIESLDGDAGVDLVLMDVMMPEMDGHETTRALRADERFAELPIISLTAKAMKGDREKSIAAGASDYIAKPVDVEQLISLMRVWLYR
jgi:signal transduction histidine kinase/CheY-like chemotaxis protein